MSGGNAPGSGKISDEMIAVILIATPNELSSLAVKLGCEVETIRRVRRRQSKRVIKIARHLGLIDRPSPTLETYK